MANEKNQPRSGTNRDDSKQQRAGEKSAAQQKRDTEGQFAGKKDEAQGDDLETEFDTDRAFSPESDEERSETQRRSEPQPRRHEPQPRRGDESRQHPPR